MTLYALYRSETGALPEAVPEKFSWFAALLPPLHALVHGLWGQLALVVLAVAALLAGIAIIGAAAALWLYLLVALACGFAAPGARRRALRRRGYVAAGHYFAADAALARLVLLEAR